MRLGLISDVHADVLALDSALNLLTRMSVDKILCAGGLVEKGADGDAVVRKLNDWLIPSVLGNHDHNALRHAELEPSELTPPTLGLLSQLPQIRCYEWELRTVLVFHGIHEGRKGRYPLVGSKHLRKLVRYWGADVVVNGHAHNPRCERIDGVLFVNPGAVAKARPRDSHTCAILTLPSLAFEVYDIASGSRM